MARSNNDANDNELISRAQAHQKDKYGGMNFGAAFFGWLVANSVSVLLIALLSALGSAVALSAFNTPRELASQAPTVGIVSGALLLIALAIAYFAGGYVAGRMSRFDGGKQGIAVWLIGLIVTIILGLAGALLGSSFNLLQRLNLPSIPVDGSTLTAGGLITLLAALIITALAAIAGGKAGIKYHGEVDRAGRVKNFNRVTSH